MQITDILARSGGLQSMARELGVSEQEAATGTAALLPAILGGFKKQVRSEPAGADGLGAILGRVGGGELLDEVVSPQPTDVNRGNAVLGEVFGSKDVSRTVAQDAASRTGLDPALLKRMLPLVAMVAAGLLAKQRGAGAPGASGGGLGGMLGGMLGGQGGAARAGGGGLLGMLDLDGDGNPLDDILGMTRRGR
jgi:hypothetical protein